MKIETRGRGNTTIVDIEGGITIGAAVTFLADTINRLISEGRTHIVLNIQHVTFMDSAGLGELVVSYKRVRDAGGTTALLVPGGKIDNFCRYAEFMPVYDDERKATGEA